MVRDGVDWLSRRWWGGRWLGLALLCIGLGYHPLWAQSVDLSQGEVQLTLKYSPAQVVPQGDLILTLEVESPAHLKVVLPDLRARFSGFQLAEDFNIDPVEAGGRRRFSQRWRLVPQPAAERYRLAPFAVTVVDVQDEQRVTTFATRPVLFPAASLDLNASGAVEVEPKPFYVAPTRRSLAFWGVALVVGAALLYGAGLLIRRLARHVRELQMSPMERALLEFERLKQRNLPQRGLFKDFYVELTMVVRRYIERTRGIRAPGQTTQEFLAAATDHPSFSPEVLVLLKEFLESADLIKFANQQATIKMTEDASSKAHGYIENDARLEQYTARNEH